MRPQLSADMRSSSGEETSGPVAPLREKKLARQKTNAERSKQQNAHEQASPAARDVSNVRVQHQRQKSLLLSFTAEDTDIFQRKWSIKLYFR